MVKVKHWCWNYYTIKKNSIAYCKFCTQSYGSGYVQRMLNHLLTQCKKIPSELRDSLIIKDNKDKNILLSHANSRLLFFIFVMQILGYYFLILLCEYSVIIFSTIWFINY